MAGRPEVLKDGPNVSTENESRILLVDIDSLYDGEIPEKIGDTLCKLGTCDRGDYRTQSGHCTKQAWCPHARSTSQRKKQCIDLSFKDREPVPAAIAALEKIYRDGWCILYWSARPRKQYTALLEILQASQYWEMADPTVPEPILMRYHPEDEEPETTKLTLLETNLGEKIDQGTKVAVIESEKRTIQVLSQYLRGRAWIHSAPKVWLNILAVDPMSLSQYMAQGYISSDLAQLKTD